MTVYTTSKLLAGVIGVCFAIAPAGLGEPQQVASPPKRGEARALVSSEDHERVLDLVFSPVTQPPRDLVFAITLRFRPAFEPESQVIIRQGRGQTADVEYLAARRKVSTTVDELLRTKPEAQPGELARAVRVQRRIFKLPAARAFALQAGLFASLNETMSALRAAGQTRHRSGVVSVTLDGESYDLWYEQGLTKFSGSFSASEADLVTAPNAVGIGQWARALHDEMIHAGEADR